MNRAIFLCGSSASGKSTIYERAKDDRIMVCCKATTRDLRYGEKEGIDFFVKTENEFTELEKKGAFIDVSGRYGKRYGIVRDWFNENIRNRDIVLYTHTYDSMARTKKNLVAERHKTVTVAVLCYETDIRKRLFERNRSEPNRQARSIEEAIAEQRNISRYLTMFDHMVINTELEEAVRSFQSIRCIYGQSR